MISMIEKKPRSIAASIVRCAKEATSKVDSGIQEAKRYRAPATSIRKLRTHITLNLHALPAPPERAPTDTKAHESVLL